MTIRVVLADDHRMLREALTGLLAREPDIEIVGHAGTGPETIELVERLRPEVLVLDIAMPELNGIEVARMLRVRQSGPKVVALSAHADKRFVREMVKAGAAGYVLKSAAGTELVQAIRAVVQGKLYLCPDIARAAVSDDLLSQPAAAPVSLLGRRERQVLALLADGKRTREIAAALRISGSTVEAHRRSIMRKLGLHTVAELTKYALREGLTTF